MMRRGFKPIGERPTGKRELRQVELSDGKVIEFDDGYGRVPRRGSHS